jgi:hypothetical protein
MNKKVINASAGPLSAGGYDFTRYGESAEVEADAGVQQLLDGGALALDNQTNRKRLGLDDEEPRTSPPPPNPADLVALPIPGQKSDEDDGTARDDAPAVPSAEAAPAVAPERDAEGSA